MAIIFHLIDILRMKNVVEPHKSERPYRKGRIISACARALGRSRGNIYHILARLGPETLALRLQNEGHSDLADRLLESEGVQ